MQVSKTGIAHSSVLDKVFLAVHPNRANHRFPLLHLASTDCHISLARVWYPLYTLYIYSRCYSSYASSIHQLHFFGGITRYWPYLITCHEEDPSSCRTLATHNQWKKSPTSGLAARKHLDTCCNFWTSTRPLFFEDDGPISSSSLFCSLISKASAWRVSHDCSAFDCNKTRVVFQSHSCII